MGSCSFQSTMCACLVVERAEVTAAVNSSSLFTHVHMNAVFFLRFIHPVRLQCDIREIYGYFLRMSTNNLAVCTRPPFFIGGLGTRLASDMRLATGMIPRQRGAVRGPTTRTFDQVDDVIPILSPC